MTPVNVEAVVQFNQSSARGSPDARVSNFIETLATPNAGFGPLCRRTVPAVRTWVGAAVVAAVVAVVVVCATLGAPAEVDVTAMVVKEMAFFFFFGGDVVVAMLFGDNVTETSPPKNETSVDEVAEVEEPKLVDELFADVLGTAVVVGDDSLTPTVVDARESSTIVAGVALNASSRGSSPWKIATPTAPSIPTSPVSKTIFRAPDPRVE